VGAEQSSEADQQLVADPVAEGVVDELEVVDVQEQHRDAAPVPPAACQRVVQAVAQQLAVGQAGQRIVQGLVAQRVLHPLLLLQAPLQLGVQTGVVDGQSRLHGEDLEQGAVIWVRPHAVLRQVHAQDAKK